MLKEYQDSLVLKTKHTKINSEIDKLNKRLTVYGDTTGSTDDTKDVCDYIRYHTDILSRYHNEEMTDNEFIKEMGDACRLKMYIFDGIVDMIEAKVHERVDYIAVSIPGMVTKNADISSVIICELYLHKYAPFDKYNLSSAYIEYLMILKQVMSPRNKDNG